MPRDSSAFLSFALHRIVENWLEVRCTYQRVRMKSAGESVPLVDTLYLSTSHMEDM